MALKAQKIEMAWVLGKSLRAYGVGFLIFIVLQKKAL